MVKITSGFPNEAMSKLHDVSSHWLASKDFAEVQRFRAWCLYDCFSSEAFLVKQAHGSKVSKNVPLFIVVFQNHFIESVNFARILVPKNENRTTSHIPKLKRRQLNEQCDGKL